MGLELHMGGYSNDNLCGVGPDHVVGAGLTLCVSPPAPDAPADTVRDLGGPPVEPPPVRLENWSVVFKGGPYYPPEMQSQVLCGDVYGHPKRPDGDLIRTSRIVAARGHLVTTRSGSVYRLGVPDPDYVKWVESQGTPWDAENPLRFPGPPRADGSAEEAAEEAAAPDAPGVAGG